MQRGSFSGRIGFIAAAAGSAVGLGNIWGFPYKVSNGGGAIFVLVYLIICFAFCLPVMLAEIAIGRASGSNSVGAFAKLGFRKWRGIGMLGIIAGLLIFSFYNVIAGWAFGYTLEMANGNFGIADSFGAFTSNVVKIGIYGAVFMLITALIVTQGVSGGIEKASKLLMPALLVMIVALAIYALTLPHAMEGIRFYLLPDFSKLNGKVIMGAMGQAFFSLSLGMGALITFGSYVGKQENIVSSAVIITLADITIAILAGFMIFPLLGFITNGTMNDIPQGPELVFVTLPHVFASMGEPYGTIFGTCFFLLLCFAALTSTVSLLEVPVSYLVDDWKLKRRSATWLVAAVIFVMGIPSLLSAGYSANLTNFIRYPNHEKHTDFLSFVANVANDSMLPLCGSLIVIFASHIWRMKNMDAELALGNPTYQGSLLQRYMRIALPYIIPFILLFVFFTTVYKTFF